MRNETFLQMEITCPHCGYVYSDSKGECLQNKQNETMLCCYCGKHFKVRQETIARYTSWKDVVEDE